jgi:hypothetical protein
VATEEPSRRERLTIKALDPLTQGEIDVHISHRRLLAVGRRTKGQIREMVELVPLALQCRGPVFEGLRREADEDRDPRGVGWRCYCCRPDRSYSPDGDRQPPRPGRVFLVFVNEDRVAYARYWDKADPDDPTLPRDHENRFKRRLA